MPTTAIEKPITPNDLDFVNYWLINGRNGLKAYQKVHPEVPDDSAKVLACKILTKVNVKAEIARQQAELITKMGYSKEQAHLDLMEDRQLARDQKQPSAAIKADSQLIRLYGMDQVEAHRESTIIVINPPSSVKKTESEVIENEV